MSSGPKYFYLETVVRSLRENGEGLMSIEKGGFISERTENTINKRIKEILNGGIRT